MAIRAVLLDMDGTIWDSPVDWAGLRCSLGLPEDGRPIVEHLKQAAADDRARGLGPGLSLAASDGAGFQS